MDGGNKMPSIGYNKAKEIMQEMEKDIGIEKFSINGHNRVIAIKHHDGSYLEFHSAVSKEIDKEWLAVFTEHHGNHIYYHEDIKFVTEWEIGHIGS